MDNKKIKSVLETFMFTWGEPLDVKEAAKVLDMEWRQVYKLMEELKDEYEERNGGIKIRRVNKSFQFVTSEDNFEYLEKFFTPVKNKRLSQSALEVLAIIAYKQPVTRGEIEGIRGIRCERVLERLEDRGFIKNLGRSEAIGRPILYGTTEQFLQYMNMESLKDLPKLDEEQAEIFKQESLLDNIDAIDSDQLEGQVKWEKSQDKIEIK